MVVEIHLEIQNLAQCLQGVDQFAQLEQFALLAHLERVTLLAQHLQGVVDQSHEREVLPSSSWIVGLKSWTASDFKQTWLLNNATVWPLLYVWKCQFLRNICTFCVLMFGLYLDFPIDRKKYKNDRSCRDLLRKVAGSEIGLRLFLVVSQKSFIKGGFDIYKVYHLSVRFSLVG